MINRELFVGGVRIADESECYVIAEIGHNHQGDVEQAKKNDTSRCRCWGECCQAPEAG